MDCEFVDPAKEPFATYIFKYRSRGESNTSRVLLHANVAQMHSSHFSSYHGAQVLYRWKSETLIH